MGTPLLAVRGADSALRNATMSVAARRGALSGEFTKTGQASYFLDTRRSSMKPATVFLSQMTNRELEQFLEKGRAYGVLPDDPRGPLPNNEKRTWGDATQASAEKGRQFLEWGAEAVLSLLEDINNSFSRLSLR
jgi:hypothetical protein